LSHLDGSEKLHQDRDSIARLCREFFAETDKRKKEKILNYFIFKKKVEGTWMLIDGRQDYLYKSLWNRKEEEKNEFLMIE